MAVLCPATTQEPQRRKYKIPISLWQARNFSLTNMSENAREIKCLKNRSTKFYSIYEVKATC